jgi:hypothetical protein
MPVLKNARHERFVQELFKGKSQAEAYERAGYKPSDAHSSRLAGNGRIAARLTELQEAAARRANTTADDIARQLDEDRDLAREVKVPSAAVSASMGKAKLFGLIKERHEHTGANGGPIKHDLSGLSDEQLAQLRNIIGSLAPVGGDRRRDPQEGGGSER